MGQHRECAALRGNGWGKPHSTVNYVFDYDRTRLYRYHNLVMQEMTRRGYRVDPAWLNAAYRGKQCEADQVTNIELCHEPVYSEHNEHYLGECLENLKNKGIDLKSILTN